MAPSDDFDLFTHVPFGLVTLWTNWMNGLTSTLSAYTNVRASATFADGSLTAMSRMASTYLPAPIISTFSSLPSLEASELCMIFVPVACYWIYSTLLYVLSWLHITSVELHRIPTDQKMRPPNRITVRHVIQKVAIQHIIQCIVAYSLAVGTRPADMATRPIEHPLLLVAKICVAAVLLDSYQYWMHRWMHTNRFLYRHFHSVHHELTVLYAYGALYNHPLEGFIMDTVGSGVPSLILDMHPWTSTIFFSLATLKTVDDHCGYALPWDPFQRFFRNNAVYHDIHHWGKGRMYNFSQPFFTFWDVWMGTDYEVEMKKTARAKALATPETSTSPRAIKVSTLVKRSVSTHAPKRVTVSKPQPSSGPRGDSGQSVHPPSPSNSSSDWSIADSALGSSCEESDASSGASAGTESDADEGVCVRVRYAHDRRREGVCGR
ncbi:hypothetical protein SpCBS45565_g06331 [Spizellomyces sp. 'palustris']|nr:hypothetical protein SpCBS45565_g06331 [Spizellomyces sp. 'palustris']